MSLADLALLLCPKEFRDGYRREFRYTRPSEAWNLAWTGVALRSESLARDAAFAARSLAKSPLFTAVIVITLALAISVNAAVFSIVNALLLKPLPFVQPDRLMFVCANAGTSYCQQMKNGEIGQLRETSHALEGIAAFQYESFTLTGFGVPQSIDAGYVSANYFEVLGIHPELGRFLTPADARAGVRNVVISDALWRNTLSAAPNVIGRTIALDGAAWRVVGVAPPRVAMPIPYYDSPQFDTYQLYTAMPERSFHTMQGLNDWAFARLKPNVSVRQARNELDSVAARIAARYPALEKGLQLNGYTFSWWYFHNARVLLYITWAAVLAVLLIACANIANLLLVRGIARGGEFAVRDALGAGRRRILQQLIVEIAIVTLIGGALGLGLSWFELRGVIALNPQSIIPDVAKASIDARVALFTFGVAAFAALLAGIIPMFAATRRGLAAAMKSSGRNPVTASLGVRTSLVALEVALAFAVIVASGLLYRSYAAIAGANIGIDPTNTYVALTDLYSARWDDPRAREHFTDAAIARIGSLPGVESVSAARPGFWTGNGPELGEFRFPGRSYGPGSGPTAIITQVTPRYLGSLRVPLLEGRGITNDDTNSSGRVALIDRHFAQLYFGARDPVGKTLLLPEGPHGAFVPASIVGVVGNMTYFGQLDEPRIYIPNAQFPTRLPEIYIRMHVRDPQLRTHVAQAVASVDPQQSVQTVFSLEDRIAGRRGPQEVSAAMLGILAAIALLLALAGIYGVIAYSVEQRRHEIGVRMAIGARAADILRSVIGGGLRIAVIGIALGIAFAALGVRMLSSLLFDTPAFDPITFAAVIALLLAGVTFASSVPAIRAASVHPAKALRYE